jgi:hypothetical protein
VFDLLPEGVGVCEVGWEIVFRKTSV